MTSTFHDHELGTLVALAETLIPADETPGADVAWARTFLVEHVRRHPAEQACFRVLASHVDALAMADHGRAFALLAVSAREALLTAHHPTLSDDTDLGPDERALRRAMRDIIAGFLTADELDIHDDPFWLRPDAPHRDRAASSSPDFAAADSVPDLAIDRRNATTSGRGTYARVWRAAGYASPPGLPQSAEDLVRIPIRTKPVRLVSSAHPLGTPRQGMSPNGPLACATWLVARGLLPRDSKWFVEVMLPSLDAVVTVDEYAMTHLRIEIRSDEWGYTFRHEGRTSCVRVTDAAFVHGSDEYALLANTPALNNIGRLVGRIEARCGLRFDRKAALIRTSIVGAEAVIRDWIATV